MVSIDPRESVMNLPKFCYHLHGKLFYYSAELLRQSPIETGTSRAYKSDHVGGGGVS